MRWLRTFVILFIMAWAANIASCHVQGRYNVMVSNLCVGAEAGPEGPCYERLPTGGFPVTYAWDTPGVSVQGKLSIAEDRFDAKLMWLNFGVYFVLFAGIWKFRRRHKRLKPLN